MTTGTIGSILSQTTAGNYSYKTWTGGNGRTETYGGALRNKWNSYSATFQRRQWAHRNLSYYRPGGCGNYWVNTTYVGPGVNLTISWPSNEELKLQQRLLSQVKSHDFNLGVECAQVRQLTRMVDSNLRKFGRAALALRRGDFATAARQFGARSSTTRLKPSDVSGRWLELQYGWKPALQSTFEAAKAFEAISNGPRSSTVRVTRQRRLNRTVVDGSSSYFLYDVEETYRKSILYQMYEEMSVQRQLGLVDPASVAWELIPWSFVVDWFIPIGSYLSNLNQIPKLRGRFSTSTVRTGVWKNQRRHPTGNEPCRQQFSNWAPMTLTRSEVSRSISTALSVPFPRFVGQGAVHGNRVWNAIALAQQAFTGKVMRR